MGWSTAGLRTALSFLTRLPVAPGEPFDLASAVAWFPLVGAGVGAFATAVDAVMGLLADWSPWVRGALMIVVILLVTGMLHLDGLMDTVDGVASGRRGEEMLAVMRDSRVGAAGAAAGALYLILAVGSLAELSPQHRPLALVQALSTGRLAMVLAGRAAPAGRHAGLGAQVAGRVRTVGAVLAVAATVLSSIPFAIGSVCGGRLAVRAGIALAVGAASGTALAWQLERRLGGVNGDVFGAVCAVAEIAVLLVYAA